MQYKKIYCDYGTYRLNRGVIVHICSGILFSTGFKNLRTLSAFSLEEAVRFLRFFPRIFLF